MQLVGTVVLFLFLLVRLFVSFVRLFLFLCVLLICLLVCARVRVCACGVGMYVVTYLVATTHFDLPCSVVFQKKPNCELKIVSQNPVFPKRLFHLVLLHINTAGKNYFYKRIGCLL